jgi:DNA-directed RNA polymerase specialized sigma24 family protein
MLPLRETFPPREPAMESMTQSPPVAPRLPAETDWGAFVDSYGRALLEWLRLRELPPAEVEALARDFLHVMAREFVPIAADPALRFRAWLQYAARLAWSKLSEGHSDDEQSPKLSLLRSAEAQEACLKALDAECSHQRRRDVLLRAQSLADPADWEAFYLVVLAEQSVAEAAERMDCSELAVYSAVHRVQVVLKQELTKLEVTC